MRNLAVRFARALMLAASLCTALSGAQQAQTFSREQLDQMMAPIALYPDQLLSQVLMAATYPADVADAAKWSKANPGQKGDAALKAVADQPWDPSVQSLVVFPQVLQTMGDQPDWVQNLGDAFLASSKDVLDSAQRLRAQAQKTGNLKSSEQQKIAVVQEPQTQQTVITIEPANPQVVYVPAYNPTVVYGAWPYPAYPPVYYPPPPAYYPGAALATGIAFGVGVAATAALWSNCNWNNGNVNINAARYNNVNVNRQINANQTNFQHNAANRRGVPYRDTASQQQFGKNVAGASQRADYRGRDTAARDTQRQQAQSQLQQRGMDPGQGREQLRNDPATRDRAQSAAQDGRRDREAAGRGERADAAIAKRADVAIAKRADVATARPQATAARAHGGMTALGAPVAEALTRACPRSRRAAATTHCAAPATPAARLDSRRAAAMRAASRWHRTAVVAAAERTRAPVAQAHA
jgi:hypothetical protein